MNRCQHGAEFYIPPRKDFNCSSCGNAILNVERCPICHFGRLQFGFDEGDAQEGENGPVCGDCAEDMDEEELVEEEEF